MIHTEERSLVGAWSYSESRLTYLNDPTQHDFNRNAAYCAVF